jgi:hypothetical protein
LRSRSNKAAYNIIVNGIFVYTQWLPHQCP